MALNAKQLRFCEEYIVDLNATQAAIRAGYSEKSAKAQGCRLLTYEDVSRTVARLQQERSHATGITAAYVLEGLKRVHERCLKPEPVMVFDPNQGGLVQAIDEDTGRPLFKFDSTGANRALELLGKHLGIFDDKAGKSESTSLSELRKVLGE